MKNGEKYHPLDAYVQAMIANIMFTKSLAQKFQSDSIAAFSTNPGSKLPTQPIVQCLDADYGRYQEQCPKLCHIGRCDYVGATERRRLVYLRYRGQD